MILYKKIISEKIPFLSPTEKKLALAIVNDEINVFDDSAKKVCQKLDFSPALVSRFCRKYGFSGWKEFQGIAIASLSKNWDPNENDKGIQASLNLLLSRVFQNVQANNESAKIAKMIKQSKSTLIVANGFTKDLSKLFAKKLSKAGFSVDVQSYDSALRIVKPDKLIIFVTISGLQGISKLSKLFEANRKVMITLGDYDEHYDANIKMNIFKYLPYSEHVFPLSSDVVLLYIFNTIFHHLVPYETYQKFIDLETVK